VVVVPSDAVAVHVAVPPVVVQTSVPAGPVHVSVVPLVHEDVAVHSYVAPLTVHVAVSVNVPPVKVR
jgi:hypothetical protein